MKGCLHDLVEMVLVPGTGWNTEVARTPTARPQGVQWNVPLKNTTGRGERGVIPIVGGEGVWHLLWEERGCGTFISPVLCVMVLFLPAGILRNISSAGEPARSFMRNTTGLVDTLLWLLKAGVQQAGPTQADEKVKGHHCNRMHLLNW